MQNMFKLITASTIKTYNFGDSPKLKFAAYSLFTGSWLVEGNDFAALLHCTSSFREALATFIFPNGNLVNCMEKCSRNK